MNYFKDCTTIDEAKKLFWDLAKKHHPDMGGDTAIFQEINNQFEQFTPGQEKFTGESDQWSASEYAHIINQLIVIPEIVIEIVGCFIWISGNTKPYKEQIKEIDTGEGFRRGWSRDKNKWYFSPKGYRKKSSKHFSYEEIQNLFDKEEVNKKAKKQLQHS